MILQTRRVHWILTTVLALPWIFGCEAGSERLALVRGKVSYRGTPLTAGTIVFTPDGLRGTTGPMARSEIHSDGTYELQTSSLPGAPIGWHRVTIMAVDSRAVAGAEQEAQIPQSLLPEKYRDPELSGLSCEVRAYQENRIDFDLD